MSVKLTPGYARKMFLKLTPVDCWAGTGFELRTAAGAKSFEGRRAGALAERKAPRDKNFGAKLSAASPAGPGRTPGSARSGAGSETDTCEGCPRRSDLLTKVSN
jgi:hypothetical protein